jgi:hypothetical protein
LHSLALTDLTSMRLAVVRVAKLAGASVGQREATAFVEPEPRPGSDKILIHSVLSMSDTELREGMAFSIQ